jgi:hypothetical protein
LEKRVVVGRESSPAAFAAGTMPAEATSMRNSRRSNVIRSSLFWLAALAVPATAAWAQTETFTAVASVKTAGGTSTTAPLTATVDRYATDADRNGLMAAIKTGGTEAGRAWLAKQKDAGTLQVGAQKAAIKYAYARPTGAGRLITIATAEPIALLGAGLPGAKSTAGYELALLLLNLPGSGAGTGELSPGAKVRVNDQGAIVTEDFAAANVVQLTNVVKK